MMLNLQAYIDFPGNRPGCCEFRITDSAGLQEQEGEREKTFIPTGFSGSLRKQYWGQ